MGRACMQAAQALEPVQGQFKPPLYPVGGFTGQTLELNMHV